ncbi:hypothetical protein [Rossellomorea arthrocnemi]|uniref:hypothetical protein n=1 Tax=Rossellomorea arthrocnemi TaxID=2769542 RepID=UPI001917C533|nr:hypothetical protein [Rossellomorea arthrocnemi]
MKLIFSIFLCMILGYILLMLGPLAGGVIAFGLVMGTLFRGLYVLNDIHKRLKDLAPGKDRVGEVYEEYLKDRDRQGDEGNG